MNLSKANSIARSLGALALLALTLPLHAAVKVDVSRSGRGDTRAPGYIEWQVKPETASTNFGGVQFTLRQAGGDARKLEGGLYKSGIETGAKLACDGVLLRGAEASVGLELVLSGLAPGPHTLATFHNVTFAADAGSHRFDVSLNGAMALTNVQPTVLVTNDYDCASAFMRFTAEAGKDVALKFTPSLHDGTASAAVVVLNGFELDASDPARRATRPKPFNYDEHTEPDPLLTWQAGKGANAHHLYFGTDSNAVANATPESPEFKGKLSEAQFATSGLSHFNTYFWRVDSLHARSRQTTQGEVWQFRPRHLAFPTAEGYGRFAIGGRGGRVIEVTNLDDYDPTKGEAVIPGSFRAAVESEGPRTITFRVSGLIRLKRPCAVSKPYCTIAGQTAPGDGICLANFSAGAYGSHDVIIRFMRFRVGDFARKAMDGAGMGSCDHCIMDHCSISWSSDEGTSSRGAKNITFQRSIVAEALHHSYHYRANDRSKFETHAFAGSISGGIGSFHHNLLAHCTDRNWSLAGGLTQGGKYAGRLDIRNNVVFNWTARTTDGGVKELNYVNNYYKPFPKNPFVKWLLKLDPLNPAWGTEQYYMDGNVLEGFVSETNNWSAFKNGPDIEKQVRVDAPLFESFVQTHTAREAFTNVLADVGATFPKLDVIDRRLIEEARTGTTHYTGTRGPTYGDRPGPNFAGIIDEPTDNKDALGSPNFPWPEYKSAPAPPDSDHDGIPDEWEIAHGLNPNDPRDANFVRNADGYTNLEVYLGWLVGEFPNVK